MEFFLFIPIGVWYVVFILLTDSTNANNIYGGNAGDLAIIHSCVGLKPSRMEICKQVELEDEFITDGMNCKIEDCKTSCCTHVKDCFKSNYFTSTRIECVYEKLREYHGSCCNIKREKIDRTQLLYLSGGFGLAVISTGIYLLATSKSNSVESYETDGFEEQESFMDVDDNCPHLKVEEVLATDGADPFWD